MGSLPRRPTLWAVIAAAALLLLAACGDDGAGPDTQPTPAPPVSPSPSPTPAPTPTADPTDQGLREGWALCTNEREGYAIGHPQDWQVDAPGLEQECALFDPEPFQVEPATEAPVTAMIVDVPVQSFQEVSERLTDPHAERILTRDEIRVAGRDAVRFEAVQTQDLLYPEGTMRYGYAVDHDGETLLVMTLSVGGEDPDYEENKEVVDQAVETLRFDV